MQQRIQPLQVPWQIDSGAPLLTLTVREGQKPFLEILFLGILLDPEEREKGLYTRRDHQILVRIDLPGWTRTTPESFFDLSEYDWSSVEKTYRPFGIVDPSRLEVRAKKYELDWMRTNICPKPRAYTIHNSHWMQEIGSKYVEKDQHYLFMGEDLYIEVIGGKLSWESKGIIDWSQAKPYKPDKKENDE